LTSASLQNLHLGGQPSSIPAADAVALARQPRSKVLTAINISSLMAMPYPKRHASHSLPSMPPPMIALCRLFGKCQFKPCAHRYLQSRSIAPSPN